MVHGRISTKTKERFRRNMQDVVKGLSRRIQVYKQSIKSECPNCFFDKLTNSSTGKCKWTALDARNKQAAYELASANSNLLYKFFKVGRCPICKGKGFLETPRKVWLHTLVNWDPNVGSDGTSMVELKTNPKYYELFRSCEKIIIDGVECKIAKSPLIRGLGGEAILIITAFTINKLDINNDERLKTY